MRYGREDELESDALASRIMAEAGYDPRALIGVMETLARASSGSRQPEVEAGPARYVTSAYQNSIGSEERSRGSPIEMTPCSGSDSLSL